MSKIYWDNGEEITDGTIIRFFSGSATYDLIEKELSKIRDSPLDPFINSQQR